MLDDPLLQFPMLNKLLLHSPKQREAPKHKVLHLAKMLDDAPLRAVEQQEVPEHDVLPHPRLLDHPKLRQGVEYQDCAKVRYYPLYVPEHQEASKHDTIHRMQVWTYKVLLFLVGDVPWVLLLLCSLPWVLWPILCRCWQRPRAECTDQYCPYLTIGPSTDQAKPILQTISSSLKLDRFNVLLWMSAATLANTAIASIYVKLYDVHVYFCVMPIGIYAVTFATAALYRAILRQWYGHDSKESAAVDKLLLEAFGVSLTRRGSSSRWSYPLLSIGPATLFWALLHRISRAEFDISCRPSVNGTFVMDPQHCTLHNDSSNYFGMMPFIVSHVMLVYSITKGFAKFMVLMDQGAQGLPSEMQAWSVKAWIEQPPLEDVFKH